MADKSYHRSYLTVRQFAERMQIGTDCVLTHIHSGRLRAVNVSTGKRPTWRIPLDAIVTFETAQSVRPAEKPKRRRRRDSAVIEFF